jgi:hypothetical protein
MAECKKNACKICSAEDAPDEQEDNKFVLWVLSSKNETISD